MPAARKSEVERDLHGSPKTPHDRAADLSHVAAGRPKFPKDLGEELRPIFKRLCKLLQERRVLTSGDAELIRLYCFQWERHSKNVALLRDEGEICKYVRLDSNGQPHDQWKTNLRLKVVTDAERQMAGILNQLGLTPTAKDRAKPTKDEKQEKELTPEEKFIRDFEAGNRVRPFIAREPYTPHLPDEPED